MEMRMALKSEEVVASRESSILLTMVLVHLRSKEIVVFAGQAQAGVFLLFLFLQADVQAQALQLFEQNVEGFGNAGLTDGVALDDGFIGIDASGGRRRT